MDRSTVDPRVIEFLADHHSAVMVTLRSDGTPHVSRIDVALVDGRLWSSGTRTRLRTRHLRRDPRVALCVFGTGSAPTPPWRPRAAPKPRPDEPLRWVGLTCTATVLDGPTMPEDNLAFYRAVSGEPSDLTAFHDAMVAEERIIYEFEVLGHYGQF
jgi:hypothetical protein